MGSAPSTRGPLAAGRTPAELRAGKIRLLGLARDLGEGGNWEHADAPRLWRFHLHYWDWAWGLAADPDRLAARAIFARLWRCWQESAGFATRTPGTPTRPRYGPGHGAVCTGASWPAATWNPGVAGLTARAGFLRRHLEYDLVGNHLIKDLKALVGLAVFLADERLLRLAVLRLARQAGMQVLADGGHYERSPAYHCQVLADLIDVTELMRAARPVPPGELTAAVDRMRRWLGAVLTPDGRVPLLNDGYPVDGELIAALSRVRPRTVRCL